MGDAPEVVREVSVNDVRVAPEQQLFHLDHRLLSISPAAVPEGFSHFVTSMTAPVASGWSEGRVGLAPTGKAPPYTAHTQSGHSALRE